MNALRLLSTDEFALSLGFTDQGGTTSSSFPLAPWGVARLIRREVRRSAVVTRRDLGRTLEPYFLAASFDDVAKTAIQQVASAMAEVGELADLKVENQRGYSALPARWIQIHENGAVLLGTTATGMHRFQPQHQNQFLRRFRPSRNIVSEFSRLGVVEQSFDAWLGTPGWRKFSEPGQSIDTLDDLLSFYLGRLDSAGSPVRPGPTNILVVDHRPGGFFGSERNPKNSRWIPCDDLEDGVYIGAQRGQNENHWIPLLIRKDGGIAKTLELFHRRQADINDLRNWMLIAIGARNHRKEIIRIEAGASQVSCTFPMPAAIQRILRLVGEQTGGWQRYAVSGPNAVGDLLRRCIPEVDVR